MDKLKLEKKFEEVYAKRIAPRLMEFERERIDLDKKIKSYLVIGVVIIVALYFLSPPFNDPGSKIGTFIFLAFLTDSMIYGFYSIPFVKKIKQKLLNAVLSVFGQFFYVEQELVTEKEIKDSKLFPLFTSKNDDDNISGLYKDLDVYITETTLSHQVNSGKHTSTVIDFKGLLVKVRMKKNFKGTTIIRSIKNKGSVKRGLQKVNLEDPEFSEMFEVFSDDQIESRYLITTAFMERFKNLKTFFRANELDGFDCSLSSLSCMFNGGYIILAIPVYEDFFEVGGLSQTLLNKEMYKEVVFQIAAILDLIESMKLEQNIGM